MAITYLQIGMNPPDDAAGVGADYVTLRENQLIPPGHDYLMAFLDAPLAAAEKLARDYVDSPSVRSAESILVELRNLHPFFHLCPSNAVITLNRMLAGYARKHYNDSEAASAFDKLFIRKYGAWDDAGWYLENRLESSREEVLGALYDLQSDILGWVFCTLDNTSPALAALSPTRRSTLYSQLFRNSLEPMLHASVQYSHRKTAGMRGMEARLDFDESAYKELHDGFEKLMRDPMVEPSGVLKEMIDATEDATEECEEVTYVVESFRELLELEVYHMTFDGVRMKRCKNCDRYFIAEKSNQEYCSRLAPGSDRLCTEVGRTRVYGRKMTGSRSAEGLYRKAYKTHYARFRRGQMDEDAFTAWKETARKMCDDVTAGTGRLDDYEKWLKE